MCLLNGDISGNIHANSTRFDIIETYDDDGNRTETKIPIKQIIKEAVHAHAGEALHNIIINDIEDYGLELLEYRGKEPLYVLFDKKDGSLPTNIRFNLGLGDSFRFKSLNTSGGLFINETNKNLDTFGEEYVGKIEFGQTAGYRLTDLIFPGELLANTGETITSVLDKIKNMLGDFEYFYDVDGRFIF
jgi:hypothetical protein